MEYFVTDKNVRFERRTAETASKPGTEMRLVKVYPQIRKQTVLGFGGALTEASAYVWSRMGPEKREKLLDLYFGEDGIGYSLGRVHIQSCDFSLGNRAYVEEGDETLDSFSIEGDRAFVIPFLKAVTERRRDIALLASPWSPPAYMKSNGEMNHGGVLLKKYYGLWARLVVKYLLAYREEGIPIARVTVQNEPAAKQIWDSCLFTAEEEAEYAALHLRCELDAAGLGDVKILIWDHNKDRIVERVRGSFSVAGASEAVDGIAFHWYTGDHFEALRYIHEQYPDKELLFTEGCVEYSRSRGDSQTRKAEHYAHDIIGNLLAGANGFLDWNVLLDREGGPNHVRNFCDAPVMYDEEEDRLNVNLSYYYIGHFSRFVKPGARLLLSSSWHRDLECAAFENPDGSAVAVVMNMSDRDMRFTLMRDELCTDITLEAHSIMTAILCSSSIKSYKLFIEDEGAALRFAPSTHAPR